MIVKMKKISLVVMESHKRDSLERLREIGVVHIAETAVKSETIGRLENEKAQLERSLLVIPDAKETPKQKPRQVKPDWCFDILNKALSLSDNEKIIREEIDKLGREAERVSGWGDFDPDEIRQIKKKGIDIRLYELGKNEFKKLPASARVFIINKTKNSVKLAAVKIPGEEDLPYISWPLPERGLGEIKSLLESKKNEHGKIIKEINALTKERPLILSAIREIDDKIEFEKARAGMGAESKVAFLTGFVPVTKIDIIEKAARENGWALLIQDPSDEDPAPTLIENPKWIKIIEPVFKIIGTTPGYKETDISFLFLLFFSVFFAIIVGDGGYGLLFLLFTFIARRLMPKAPAEPFILMYTMSIGTVIWGLITGTWFASEYLARNTFLSNFVVPALASYADEAETESGNFIMHLSILIGVIHLSVAHIKSFIKKMPHPTAYSDIGWLVFLWGCYFFGRKIILNQDLNPAAAWLIGIGFALIIIFSEQKDNFLKGLLAGLASLPLKVLNGISGFSDIISYIRLFAVGFASFEVARSFNGMALGIGFDFPGIFASALILFFGHALNITLSAMSLIVHGVRLNMLEFSGHLGMEWTGIEYKPFRKPEKENFSEAE